MCLLDFMRITSNGTKQKKHQQQQHPPPPQHASFSSSRFGATYMQKLSDANVIYFNENMSMTSKSNTIEFSRCPTGNFKPSVMEMGFPTTPAALMPPPPTMSSHASGRNRSMRHWVGGKGALPMIVDNPLNSIDMDSITCFECSSSDERVASHATKSSASSTIESPSSDSSLRDTETDEYVCNFSDYTSTQLGPNSGNATALDSFCTLCTSSFSFNRCNRCEASSCSSRCNSTERRKKPKPQMTDINIDDTCPETTDANGNGSGTENGCGGGGGRAACSRSVGSGMTSDYDSMRFRWVWPFLSAERNEMEEEISKTH